jgi:adenylate kinase family enzyme
MRWRAKHPHGGEPNDVAAFPYTRLAVIGATGSGKSTLAEQLAAKLKLDLIELDAINWQPNWTPLAKDEFRTRVEQLTRAERWVTAGNYSAVRDICWQRAEVVVWLDYSLWTVFRRLTFRIVRRWWSKELLWGTNYEPFWQHFKLWSEDSLWHWLFKTYWKRKREYAQLLRQPQYAHLKVFCFKRQRETDAWFADLPWRPANQPPLFNPAPPQ